MGLQDFFAAVQEFIARHKRVLRSLGLTLLVAFLTALICQSPFKRTLPDYREGDIARHDVKASMPVRVPDQEVTEARRDVAADKIVDVYDFDPLSRPNVYEKIRESFKILRSAPSGVSNEKIRRAVSGTLGTALTDQEWKVLRKLPADRGLTLAIDLLNLIDDRWLVEKTTRPKRDVASIRDINSGKEMVITREMIDQKIITTDEVERILKNEVHRLTISKIDRSISTDVLISIIQKTLEPDIAYNRLETDARREDARSKIETGYAEIERGEMILREGQRVERRHRLLLDALTEAESGRAHFSATFQFAIFLTILILILYQVGRRNFKKSRLNMRDQWVVGAFLVGSLALVSAVENLFEAAKVESMSGSSMIALLPFAFAPMTLRLFTSMEITLFFNILYSISVGWLTQDPYLAVVTLGAGLAGAARMRHITQRLDVFKAGLTAGGVKAVLCGLGLFMNLIDPPGFENVFTNLLAVMGFSLGAGVIAAAMVLGIQPLLEYLGYTTDLRLMELSSTNHPLLKDLIIQAPGTYFHSFTVSQLAEKAAEAIHANALFARVASLYHDIGKVKKPQYFIENIKGENKHDKLVPSMSALIISNHVKEGIELAYEGGLPQSIVEIIPQHHGTSLISYFYDKAMKQADDNETIDQKDFRYPGPKPQTREAAIILLADAVEATAKSLTNKSIDALKQSVHSTIQRFFLDGQLDECDLSLKDLNGIGEAFLQVLQGVYHQRIDYPHLREQVTDPLTSAKATPILNRS